MSKSALVKKYVDETLSNLDEFYVNPDKKLRVEVTDKTYEISVPYYLYCYYQAFTQMKAYINSNSMVDTIVKMFNRRNNFFPVDISFVFDPEIGTLKGFKYSDGNKFEFKVCSIFKNSECLTSEIMGEILKNVNTNNVLTYIIIDISLSSGPNTSHSNAAIYEYNSVKKQLCSVYYEPHGHIRTTAINRTIRKMLDNSIAKHFSAEIKSLPFSDYMQALGLQNQLRDDIGFCVAVSNIWLYVVLNLIYSKSFNVKAKKTEKPYIASNIRMGNKQLLSSREKYIEKVKVQRRDFIDSDFNTLSMCEWIQDVDKHIIKYYNRKPNILYNFLFMIAQYIMVNVGVKVPIAMQEGDMGSDSDENEDDIKYNTEDNFQEIFNKSVKILMKTDDLKKAIRHLEAIPRAYVTPYMMNLTFLHNALSHDYLTPVKLKRKNEKCRYDCEGNLECIDYKCKDME